MEIETIERLISSVGFPITMCGVLIYFVAQELKELRKAITENTNALSKLETVINLKDNER